jgi:hypothetical protein
MHKKHAEKMDILEKINKSLTTQKKTIKIYLNSIK